MTRTKLRTVDRGVELLDERLPGWIDAIDTDMLDMSSPCNCVFGQLFGSYQKGIEIMALGWGPDYDTHRVAKRFGFFRSRVSWARLTGEWRRLIERRRQA